MSFSHHCLRACGIDTRLREAIGEIIRKDPAVLGQALAVQFQELIVKPCRQLAATGKWQNLPRLIIIDGLDECQDSKTQKRLIETITRSFTIDEQLPLRFLICSRPEPAIRETFYSPNIKSLVETVWLNDSFQTRRDIETYLLDNLTRIRDEARERGLYPPCGWPGWSIICQLSGKASGHFSYASTVVKFVDDEYAFPWDRVDVVLGLIPNPTSESPFRDLDQLYLEILSRSPDRKRLLAILSMVIFKSDNFPSELYFSPGEEEINDVLDLRPGEFRLTLRGMHAVLDVPDYAVDDYYNNIKIHHASFTDFLKDKSRSGDYYINRNYYRQFAISCHFSRLNKQLSNHRSSPEMVFRENWFLIKIQYEWKDWFEGVEKPTDELLQTLGSFDWVALLDANLHYMLTAALSEESWHFSVQLVKSQAFSVKPINILLGIETITKWLEKFPTTDRVLSVISRLKQFSFHEGFHISLPSPLSQAISTWNTISKWVGLTRGSLGGFYGDRKLRETLRAHEPLTSSFIDSFKIVDWRDCQYPHQDQKTPGAVTECSYGVYYVPTRMFYSPFLVFLFDLSLRGVDEATEFIISLAHCRWMQLAGPMPELLPQLRVTIVPIMNYRHWWTDDDVIRSFLSWFKSFPEEYALETQALMKTMADEIKKNHFWIRPYFRWTGSELVWVEKGEREQLETKRRKRQMEDVGERISV